MSTAERPEIVQQEYLEFLDELRDGGSINMLSATPYLQNEFDLTRAEANVVAAYWREEGSSYD